MVDIDSVQYLKQFLKTTVHDPVLMQLTEHALETKTDSDIDAVWELLYSDEYLAMADEFDSWMMRKQDED